MFGFFGPLEIDGFNKFIVVIVYNFMLHTYLVKHMCVHDLTNLEFLSRYNLPDIIKISFANNRLDLLEL